MEATAYSIALVDRQEETRQEIGALLGGAGLRPHCFDHWREARSALAVEPVSAVVLCDWRRGGGRGAHRYLRGCAGSAPFVLVCDGGVARWDDRFTAVLYYPVLAHELAHAIVGAIERAASSLTCGGFVLDLKRRLLSSGEASAKLTPVETELLKVLMLAQGRFIPSVELLERAWQLQTLLDRRIVYTHVSWLRRKLEAAFGPGQLIVSGRAQGYSFAPARVAGSDRAPGDG